MSKHKITVEQEEKVLEYIQHHRGQNMKGLQRNEMYNIYSMFASDGRNVNTCSCLDRDTHKKVDNWINRIEWSTNSRTTPKMKSLLPENYIEPVEDISTQPIKIDLDKLSKSIEKRKNAMKKLKYEEAKSVPVKPVKKSKVKKK